MTIRNKQLYMESLWDWGFLDDCFGGSHIRVSDVDGLVEHNGYFLLIEAKAAGKDVPRGQAILFDNLITNDRWAILVIWGNPGNPESYRFWGYPVYPASTEKIQARVAQWYKHARDASPRPT